MIVLTKGHSYKLAFFEDNKRFQTIDFINKIQSGKDKTTLVTVHDGTTNEEVLSMLIDRMQYLQSKFPCRENEIVITKLEESLMWINKRTKDRVKRGVEGKHIK